MNQHTFLNRLETLGYYLLPQPHPDSPGYTGLLVVVRKAPFGHEPEMIRIPLYEWGSKLSIAKLHAEMEEPKTFVICPGKVVVRSKNEREATFYTFGGNLESELLEAETVFSFRSTAPILELVSEEETLVDLLAEETEILFAKTEAQQDLSSKELLVRLVKAGPENVYLAVLQSLLTADRSYDQEFINLLNSELSWYQKMGRWPLFPRDIAEIVQDTGES